MHRRAGKLALSAAAAALLAAVAVSAVAIAGPAGRGPAAKAAPLAASQAQLACGKTRTIALAAPLTGPAASLGQQQAGWARFFVSRYNKTHKKKIKMIEGDTRLPDTAAATRLAERFASDAKILGVVGPAGSQEVIVSTAGLRGGGLAFITPSASRTTLTTDGTRAGYFFRVVPNDGQQGPRVANYIRNVLKARRVVVVDDQEPYGVGLSNSVHARLNDAGLDVRRESVDPATATDFSALVARIPSNTQVVYIPWQLSSKAQLFGQQLRANGKNAVLFGSDGLFDPDNFKIRGSYISFFPLNQGSSLIAAYKRSHGGKGDLFGAPAFEAAHAIVNAVDKACANGKATRAEVRKLVAKTDIPKKQSLLGIRLRFTKLGDVRGEYGVYRIANNGAYVRVS